MSPMCRLVYRVLVYYNAESRSTVRDGLHSEADVELTTSSVVGWSELRAAQTVRGRYVDLAATPRMREDRLIIE